MIVTEKEAKTKWCPMVRFAIHGISANLTDNTISNTKNSNTNLHEVTRCQASSCMMWVRVGTSALDMGFCGLTGNALPTSRL